MANTAYPLPNMGGATLSAGLAARLLEELRAGAFAGCDRLPAEVALAARFGVSRSVVRDALAELWREGYVERARGVGTVVNRKVLQMTTRLDVKAEYNDLIRAQGAVPGTDSVRVVMTAADGEVAGRLELDTGAPLLVCEKRVLASGRPVIWSIDQLPAALFKQVDWRMLDWARPVYDLLWEACGIEVDTTVSALSAVVGPAAVRRVLALAPGDALLLMDEVGYYKLKTPILHSCGFYTSYFDFTLLRKKV